MAVLAGKNGDVSKPLLSTKGAADVEKDECAGHRESALAHLIRCAAHIPLEHAPFSHNKLTCKRHRYMCCVCVYTCPGRSKSGTFGIDRQLQHLSQSPCRRLFGPRRSSKYTMYRFVCACVGWWVYGAMSEPGEVARPMFSSGSRNLIDAYNTSLSR